MPARDPRDGRCRRRPSLEVLEARELLSALPASARSPARPAPAIVARPASPDGLLGKRAPGRFFDPRIIRQTASILYSPSRAPGTPTPAEIRRQTFTARWIGQYTIGPPRFNDRAGTIHLYGTAGGSNQFLKGKFQIAMFPPADPAATPTPGNPFANQVTGFAALFGQNYLQSGAMVALDLNGTPPAGSAPGTLPTQLSWAYDSNSAAGPYAAPGGIVPGSGFTHGAGTVTFHWMPDARPQPGTMGSGRVVVTFQGLINTSQITSGVSKLIS